jgi:20S proteasome alpha/beta subunit
MTIIVGIASPEGLILASDSRATWVAESNQHRIVSDSVQKVFKVDRFGVASYGALMIGPQTVAGLMDQFEARLQDESAEDASSLADRLGDFFGTRFQELLDETGDEWKVDERGIALGFLVGGYDSDGVGHLHSVTVPETDRPPDVTTVTRGCSGAASPRRSTD